MGTQISRSTVFFYSLPMVGGGMMSIMTASYFMKYATDSLLMAPGVVGTLFFISRIWDAVNDPAAGYLADRTRSPFGARRLWISISALPIVLSFYFLWNPPFESGPALVVWSAIFLVLFYTLLTALYVPHYSLGAEIGVGAQDRNRIFGGRAIAENIGNFLGVGAMQAFTALLVLPSISTPRQAAPWIIVVVCLVVLVSILAMMLFIKEKTEHKLHEDGFFHTLGQVFRNRKARFVLMAGFFGQLGATFVFLLAHYHAQYVIGDPQAGPMVIAVFMIAATFSIPFWVRFLTNKDKRRVWIGANLALGGVFSAGFALNQGDGPFLLLASALAGVAGAAVLIVHPASLADSIGAEGSGGETRKEATYFSVFTFMNKSAMGFASVVVGFLLQFVGFFPNTLQSDSVLVAIRGGFAFLPSLCFFTAALILYWHGKRA